jgi:hypothetical protein
VGSTSVSSVCSCEAGFEQEETEATEIDRFIDARVSPVSGVFHVLALSVAPW